MIIIVARNREGVSILVDMSYSIMHEPSVSDFREVSSRILDPRPKGRSRVPLSSITLRLIGFVFG